MSKRQFIFFASQEGQAATNLRQEQCGLFTKVLLEQLASSREAKDAWPPEMEIIASAVQQVFAENPQQYPVYKYYRDWKGNEKVGILPSNSAPSPTKTADPMDLWAAINRLAILLAKHFARPTQRDDILRAFEYCPPLGPSISARVERRSDALGDCNQIISTCLKYKGGLALLKRATLDIVGQIRDHDTIVLEFQSLSLLSDEDEVNV
jgi:hypothetical protein